MMRFRCHTPEAVATYGVSVLICLGVLITAADRPSFADDRMDGSILIEMRDCTGIAISPDGKMIGVTNGDIGSLFSSTSAKRLRSWAAFGRKQAAQGSISWAENGFCAFVSHGGSAITILNPTSGETFLVTSRWIRSTPDNVFADIVRFTSVSIDAVSKRICVGADDGIVRVLALDTRELLATLSTHKKETQFTEKRVSVKESDLPLLQHLYSLDETACRRLVGSELLAANRPRTHIPFASSAEGRSCALIGGKLVTWSASDARGFIAPGEWRWCGTSGNSLFGIGADTHLYLCKDGGATTERIATSVHPFATVSADGRKVAVYGNERKQIDVYVIDDQEPPRTSDTVRAPTCNCMSLSADGRICAWVDDERRAWMRKPLAK